MKKTMMMIAMIFAFGATAAVQAQTAPKTGADGAHAEHSDHAKKCDGLSSDARTACLKDAPKGAQKQGDMKSAPKAPEAKDGKAMKDMTGTKENKDMKKQ